MDKNTVTGFILMALVLILFSWYSRPSEEQLKAQRERDSIAAVQRAEAEKAAAILKAEAHKEAMIREAEGQAEAILKVQQATADGLTAIKNAKADDAVIKLKSLEAFATVADGKATKIIIPSEIQNMAGVLASLKETAMSDDIPAVTDIKDV